MVSIWRIPLVLGCLIQIAHGIDLDVESTDSLKSAAKTIAHGMVSFYKGNETCHTPGLLPYPPDGYYWWQAGAMFGALISYWFNTGDTAYNAITSQAILFQVGDDIDFMPLNQTTSLGNDDQSFWAMTALSAAEYNFPSPDTPGAPSWLGLAQAVFNEQIQRWDSAKCNGGLRWQAVPTNKGFNYKNTISNGCLFNIAARLARYTNDQMYANWAVKIWNWIEAVGFVDTNYRVYDGSDADTYNCTNIDHNQWSYNNGILLNGAATMFNYTKGDPIWEHRTAGLLSSANQIFFVDGGIMREGCENPPAIPCNQDQKSFKAYLARWMTVTSQLAPFTRPNITALLKTSAKAAAAQCNGGPSKSTCGIQWDKNGTWDGTEGVGQSMSALETIIGALVTTDLKVPPPFTGSTGVNPGGTSVSVPKAGKNRTATYVDTSVISTADKGGAWFMTILFLFVGSVSIWFMCSM
ncbi:hypothetical protein HYALB_00013650 [Hymenoscyphus albidus]|uniref:Mannan endo-1,6-alpha-mannosidase n=1 Tax=Hymenoscyphus albidus TaxID=595503 RepID=A0A9N9Q5C0_9HELO|nr:hypothetical protein HYALB_00013650 [Hymenoscyphus albidus]